MYRLRKEKVFECVPHVVLNTCARVEVYYGDGGATEEIIRHLYKVTSGLDSFFIGETAIQGQVKRAYLRAREEGTLSNGLNHLFQSALRAGKRVKRETSISKGAMSYETAVLNLIKQSEVKLESASIMVLGMNEMNEIIIKYLKKYGAKHIMIMSRSFDKAFSFAKKYDLKVMPIDERYHHLKHADIVISATSAPHILLEESYARFKQGALLIDLASPRDIAPGIVNNRDVTLYNVEDIGRMSFNAREERLKEKVRAEIIIEEETAKYLLSQNRRSKIGEKKKSVCVYE
ncbi:glutamyl-tRNA reductase [Candidatus Omnitrophus magneticus]|uniref:Glutamyl-tRNA reductase n=1 Tax=Candidatus Omnitrophus magneticus TaxID=1609969 RepID=A0A0F0CLM9_9BACT|nr:glutamyl-tRNA reductase [Candidatus Omnitrophus magneticus]